MTDQEIELRLRAWYRADIGGDEPAPMALRSGLAAIPVASTPSASRSGDSRRLVLLAAAVLLLSLGGALAAGSWLERPSVVVAPVPSPSMPVAGTPGPSFALASPATHGTWIATGSMAIGRQDHTATLLPDGRVLVAGGWASGEDAPGSASAELYDPDTGRWTGTGSMARDRSGHMATLLLDGTVLVVGGETADAIPAASAELYDPETGRWTPVDSMVATSVIHTATLLADGRVLVVGATDGPTPAASAELYDPSTGHWAVTGSPGAVRDLDTATLLPDGDVLVAGGRIGEADLVASAVLYDPRSGRWTVTGDMVDARHGQTATLLADGRVLVAGGSEARPAVSTELYDPGLGTWVGTGAMAVGRGGRHDSVSDGHTATLLLDGSVLVAGGPGGRRDTAAAELYDPGSGDWTVTDPMLGPRGNHTATLLPDGDVLVVGGTTGRPDWLSTAELYRPGTGD